MSDLTVRIAALTLYPVKSCAGVPVDAALVLDTGFDLDRLWMLVDRHGDMLTQREFPRLALVRPEIRHDEVLLRAPGMLALHLRTDAAEGPLSVQVWNDTLEARDMGALAAQWFSDFLGTDCRLARFDDTQRRPVDAAWSGGTDASALFADGFPLLVTSVASGQALNERLAARGQPPVGLERFRANLVLDGLDAHGEDFLQEIRFDTPEGPVVIVPTKPCVRCTVPGVDPATGVQGHEPVDTLAGYRADPRMGGGLTFGMNAVVREGLECTLRVGDEGRATIRF